MSSIRINDHDQLCQRNEDMRMQMERIQIRRHWNWKALEQKVPSFPVELFLSHRVNHIAKHTQVECFLIYITYQVTMIDCVWDRYMQLPIWWMEKQLWLIPITSHVVCRVNKNRIYRVQFYNFPINRNHVREYTYYTNE